MIYALISVPFKSYSKLQIFRLAAPVAWSGAVLAHWIAGLRLSMESLAGRIAASGVVVNDSGLPPPALCIVTCYLGERSAPLSFSVLFKIATLFSEFLGTLFFTLSSVLLACACQF